MTAIDEAELNRIEADAAESWGNGFVYSAVLHSDLRRLLAAARSLPAERRAREEAVYAAAERLGLLRAAEADIAQREGECQRQAARATTAETEAASLRERVKALEEALAPFADEAGMWGDLVPDDHAPVCVEMGHTDARYYGSAAKYTVGDLRRAAAIRARPTPLSPEEEPRP